MLIETEIIREEGLAPKRICSREHYARLRSLCRVRSQSRSANGHRWKGPFELYGRPKSRRCEPFVYVRRGLQLPDLSEQHVLLRTRWQLGDLRFQLGLLGCNLILECVGN